MITLREHLQSISGEQLQAAIQDLNTTPTSPEEWARLVNEYSAFKELVQVAKSLTDCYGNDLEHPAVSKILGMMSIFRALALLAESR